MTWNTLLVSILTPDCVTGDCVLASHQANIYASVCCSSCLALYQAQVQSHVQGTTRQGAGASGMKLQVPKILDASYCFTDVHALQATAVEFKSVRCQHCHDTFCTHDSSLCYCALQAVCGKQRRQAQKKARRKAARASAADGPDASFPAHLKPSVAPAPASKPPALSVSSVNPGFTSFDNEAAANHTPSKGAHDHAKVGICLLTRILICLGLSQSISQQRYSMRQGLFACSENCAACYVNQSAVNICPCIHAI